MKKINLFFTLLFFMHWGLNAQNIEEENVHVQTNQQNIQQDYSSFYWMDSEKKSTMAHDQGEMKRDQKAHTKDDDKTNKKDQTNKDDQMKNQSDKDKAHKDKNEYQKNDDMHEQQKTMHSQNQQGLTDREKDYYSSEMKKSSIKQAIIHEMVSNGYQVSPENPDLLISYQIFDKKGEISNFNEREGNVTGSAESINVGNGTLFLSITDNESGKAVWQGYVENAFSDSDFKNFEELEIEKSQLQAIKSVVALFDQFNLEPVAARTE